MIEKELNCIAIDPWKLTSEKEIIKVVSMPNGPEKVEAWKRLNMIIGENNRKGIDKSNGLVAILDGTDVDSGTASEIGYSYGKRKIIVGYRGDFRLSADNIGSIINLQVEYFIRASGGTVVIEFKKLKDELRKIFG